MTQAVAKYLVPRPVQAAGDRSNQLVLDCVAVLCTKANGHFCLGVALARTSVWRAAWCKVVCLIAGPAERPLAGGHWVRLYSSTFNTRSAVRPGLNHAPRWSPIRTVWCLGCSSTCSLPCGGAYLKTDGHSNGETCRIAAACLLSLSLETLQWAGTRLAQSQKCFFPAGAVVCDSGPPSVTWFLEPMWVFPQTY